ncbi:hypothetical protein Taro_007686, partial [Colocasia esculenta]|nr:hypothetical protein [Colocasia esculenta]
SPQRSHPRHSRGSSPFFLFSFPSLSLSLACCTHIHTHSRNVVHLPTHLKGVLQTKNGGKKGGHNIWPPLFSSPQPVRGSPFGFLLYEHSSKTVELPFFGRPKRGKSESCHPLLREATSSA